MQNPNTAVPDLIIRPATEADLPLISTLAYRIWPEAYAGILAPDQIENMLETIYSPENLRLEMAQGHRFWIAVYQGKEAAYASAFREDEHTIWIRKIYVASTLHGRGIGRQMIDFIAHELQPAKEIKLLVNAYNIPAHHFYTHIGFTKTGTKTVRMGDWDFDDFLFAKKLTGQDNQ